MKRVHAHEHVEEEMEMKQKLKRAAMKMFQGALTRSFERVAQASNVVSCIESFGPKMLVISAMSTDTPTIKGCEPWGGIEVLPAIFSRVVLANFSVTGKLDGLFQGPRGGNLQFQFQKKTDSTPAE